MVEFRKNASRDTLYAIAAEHSVDVPEDADRQTIIDALNAYNEREAAKDAQDGGDLPEADEPGGGENAAEAAESGADNDGANDTAGDISGAQKPAEGAQQKPQESTEDLDTFVYVGPSIPRGKLKENALFRGSWSDVLKYLAEPIEQYPQIPQLIVPTSRLAVFSAKVKTPGNIAHKYYNDILSAVRGKKEG